MCLIASIFDSFTVMKQLFLFFYLCISVSFAQQTLAVDFITCSSKIRFQPNDKKVIGIVNYHFKILKSVDSIYLDAKHMTFNSFSLNGKSLNYRNDGKRLWLKASFKKGQSYSVAFNYETLPKKALYFIKKDNDYQIWTQGQGKYTSNWLPSIDDENEKIEFDLSVTFHKDYEVIANGKLKGKKTENALVTWHYDMKAPMASYLVALGVGRYLKKTVFSKRGTPLQMYYYPEDSLKFEPTYRYTKEVFDFLEDEIGVRYPWQNYKMLPVKDFLYAGMENTSLNIFSDTFVVDSLAFNDRNFVNINAHELAHQWFGDLVTATSGTHHWLQEGFATYYALLAEQELFGTDYYNWRLYEYAQQLKAQDEAGASTSLLNPKSSSITFYKKGAWVLHALRVKVGDNAFQKGVKAYLKKYQFTNVTTENFISEMEKASGENLQDFCKMWLEDKALYYEVMEALLKLNSPPILTEHLSALPIENKYALDCKDQEAACKTILIGAKNDRLKAHIIKQLGNTLTLTTFPKEGLKSRQAAAAALTDIPDTLKADYESLLSDASYTTIETALISLWRNFPEDRFNYLDQTKSIEGFATKNIRSLWLALALITEGYADAKQQQDYLEELTAYTSPKYGFEVRQNAFQFLSHIQACHLKCKAHLKEATKHYNWRFRKFANALLKEEK